MKQDQIPSLTGLRFFAAAAVVLSHAIPKIVKFEDPPAILVLLSQSAAAGMTLFFVLSGFVIFLNYSRVIATGADLWNFFVARFARLYPLFFLCVAFDLLMKFSYSQLSVDQLSALPFYATLTQSWFYKIIGDHSLIFQYGLMPQVSWSISTEWMFYFAFPFVCASLRLLRSARQKLLATILFLAFVPAFITMLNLRGEAIRRYGVETFGPIAADQTDSFQFWLTYFSPYIRVFEFSLGCLCAAIFLSLKPPADSEQRIGRWLTAIAIGGILLSDGLLFGYQTQDPIIRILQQLRNNFGFAPSMALLIFCCARYSNAVVWGVSSKWIVLGGEISYSIYLLHFLIIDVFRYQAATITTWQIGIGSTLQLIVVLACIAGLSLVSWRFIEMPSRRAFRKLLSIHTKPKPVVACSERQPADTAVKEWAPQ